MPAELWYLVVSGAALAAPVLFIIVLVVYQLLMARRDVRRGIVGRHAAVSRRVAEDRSCVPALGRRVGGGPVRIIDAE